MDALRGAPNCGKRRRCVQPCQTGIDSRTIAPGVPPDGGKESHLELEVRTPCIMQDILGSPQRCILEPIEEQTVDLPVRQVAREILDGITDLRQERTSGMHSEAGRRPPCPCPPGDP